MSKAPVNLITRFRHCVIELEPARGIVDNSLLFLINESSSIASDVDILEEKPLLAVLGKTIGFELLLVESVKIFVFEEFDVLGAVVATLLLKSKLKFKSDSVLTVYLILVIFKKSTDFLKI